MTPHPPTSTEGQGSQQNESPDGAQAKTLTSFPTQNTSPTQNTPTQNADLPSQQSGPEQHGSLADLHSNNGHLSPHLQQKPITSFQQQNEIYPDETSKSTKTPCPNQNTASPTPNTVTQPLKLAAESNVPVPTKAAHIDGNKTLDEKMQDVVNAFRHYLNEIKKNECCASNSNATCNMCACDRCKKAGELVRHRQTCDKKEKCQLCQNIRLVLEFHKSSCPVARGEVCLICAAIGREGTERPERGGHHDENARTGPVSGGNQVNQVKPGRDSTTTAMQGSNFPNETIIEEFKVLGSPLKGQRFSMGVDYIPGRELGRGGNGVVYEIILFDPGKRKLGINEDILLCAKIANVSANEMQVLKKLVNCRYSADHYFLVQNRQDIPRFNRKSRMMVPTTFEHMMVMRRAEKSLHDYMDGHVLALEEANRFFIHVLEATQFSHNNGITHYDIKARNVLMVRINGELFAMLTDYEFAKAGFHTGPCGGTPFFKSPTMENGPTRDIYSLGIFYLEMVIPNGTSPLPRSKGMWRQFLEDKLSELKAKNIGIGTLIESCVKEDPNQRPKVDLLLHKFTELNDKLHSSAVGL